MKKYLNADGKRERIIPLWVNADWQRRLWCFFRGHRHPHTATLVNNAGGFRTLCGICGKVFTAAPAEEMELDPTQKHWVWNGEPVTWYEFCDRLEGKIGPISTYEGSKEYLQ